MQCYEFEMMIDFLRSNYRDCFADEFEMESWLENNHIASIEKLVSTDATVFFALKKEGNHKPLAIAA